MNDAAVNIRAMIKRSLLLCLIPLVKGMRFFSRKTRIVVICPPFPSESNIGDRSMCIGLINLLREATALPIHMVQGSNETLPAFAGEENVFVESQLYPLFLFEANFSLHVRWIFFLKNAKCVYMIGADSIDDSYSESQSKGKIAVLELCAKMRVPTTLLSFSVHRTPAYLARRFSLLKGRVRIRPRDPVSFERLCAAGIAGDLQESSDLSFLDPVSSDISEPTCVKFFSRNVQPIVGVNVGDPLFRDALDREVRLQYLAKAFARFAELSSVRLLLIPNSRALIEQYFVPLEAAIESYYPGICAVVKSIPSSGELKSIIGKCEYLFSTSLHLSLFALSTETPVTCFPYVGKFEGVLRLFRIPDSQIPIDSLPLNCEELALVLHGHYLRRNEIKQRVQENLPRVITMARKSVDMGDLIARS